MKVNEIFYSLQGEGFWTGTAAIFVRFSGCNLNCSFCDTHHQEGTMMSEEEIIQEISRYPTPHIIFTGGEPTLQLTRSLVDKLHKIGKLVHIETNGSNELGDGLEQAIDWITVSPKEAPVRIQRIDELKVLFFHEEQDMSSYDNLAVTHPDCHFIQPCDVGNPAANGSILNQAIEFIKRNPQWRLSLQTHKLTGIR